MNPLVWCNDWKPMTARKQSTKQQKSWLKHSCVLCLFAAQASFALDSSDLLFNLSFEDGLRPDLARGNAQPVGVPTELQRRLVQGLFGKGYLFAGKGRTIESATGAGGERGSFEMYDPKANLF